MNTALKRLYKIQAEPNAVHFSRRGVRYTVQAGAPGVAKAVPFLQTRLPLARIEQLTNVPADTLDDIVSGLGEENLIDEPEKGPITGAALCARFREVLPDWLDEAFSAPYWDTMLSGKGSLPLYIGYVLELYHYTRNANRHMPLVVSACHPEWKGIRRQLAVHYAEEWNHYHFFADALEAIGVSKSDVERSEPLPSTLEMSNFMRQAARTSILCYAICSAILEGTTEDSGSYGEYFRRISQLYDIPAAAVKPLFDHLALDAEYNHKSLFAELCAEVGEIPREEAERAMYFGRQMIDHIYLWTEHIHRYYGRPNTSVVRSQFDIARH